MRSTENIKKKCIIKQSRGKIFSTSDLHNFGNNGAVRLSLFWLCKEKFIIRRSAGVLVYPKHSKFLSEYVNPSIEEIAKAIAVIKEVWVTALLPVLLLILTAFCSSAQNSTASPAKLLFSTTEVSKYRLFIKTPQAEISGIMVIKYIDNEWRGSLINEFGIKAFDFVTTKGKTKLKNTISFLNKGVIHKTIEDDFTFLFWGTLARKILKKKSLVHLPDGSFVLQNKKRAIEYSFQNIDL